MSTTVLTAPAAKSAAISINEKETEQKGKIAATIFKDITRDPQFWKQATLS